MHGCSQNAWTGYPDPFPDFKTRTSIRSRVFKSTGESGRISVCVPCPLEVSNVISCGVELPNPQVRARRL